MICVDQRIKLTSSSEGTEELLSTLKSCKVTDLTLDLSGNEISHGEVISRPFAGHTNSNLALTLEGFNACVKVLDLSNNRLKGKDLISILKSVAIYSKQLKQLDISKNHFQSDTGNIAPRQCLLRGVVRTVLLPTKMSAVI